MSLIRPAAAAALIIAAPIAAHALYNSENDTQTPVVSSSYFENHTTGAAKSLSGALTQPDFTLQPTYGTVSLRSGFTPDPHVVDIAAGGEVQARRALEGYTIGHAGDRRCRGHIHEAPDLRLRFEAGRTLPLIIRANAEFDTTLVVNGPDGTWYCDDDSGPGVQAELHWDNPQSGQYDIWVGAFTSARNFDPAVIEISELARSGGSGGGGFGGGFGGGSASGLDFTRPALNGVISLQTGFTPDPRTVNVTARSQVSVSSALSNANVGNTGDGRCRGHTGQAPDLSVQYTAGDFFPLVVRAIASYDTTLVVNAPDGSWHCDDDSGQGVQAELVFDRPRSGRYDIWFGSFSSNRDGQRGRIEISELD
ncbi:MAG: hypothetical protein JJU18_04260 [Oceanicaulis sp.]|nr:hypothetical protein [Oceanicaulis sp.]